MNPGLLYQAGSRLIKRCGTRDPFAIADDLGIKVMECDNFGPLKGMYRVIQRNRFIFINGDLPERMRRPRPAPPASGQGRGDSGVYAVRYEPPAGIRGQCGGGGYAAGYRGTAGAYLSGPFFGGTDCESYGDRRESCGAENGVLVQRRL